MPEEAPNDEAILRDLEVLSSGDADSHDHRVEREFLTAMAVAKGSKLAGRTVIQENINKLPGIVLVSIERPNVDSDEKAKTSAVAPRSYISSSVSGGATSELMDDTSRTHGPTYTTIPPEEPLKAGE